MLTTCHMASLSEYLLLESDPFEWHGPENSTWKEREYSGVIWNDPFSAQHPYPTTGIYFSEIKSY